VLIVFDQMRADYLTRWDSLFEQGGFHRLEKEGAWFQNCNYPYASTFTAPGHASLATGCSPDRHGIISNGWYDRGIGKSIYCVSTDRYQLVPRYEGKKKDLVGDWPGAWPGRLKSETLGDALKKATDGRGRVVCLSLKDRSAILLGCSQNSTDACYWFFPASGDFVTSTYYRPNGQVHSWVAEINKEHPADRWFGTKWERLRPDLDYARYSSPDDTPGEDSGWGQGRTFPHPTTGGLEEVGESYYEAVGNSPFGNDLLLDLAKRAIAGEHLGAGDDPDLLCLSFSANDTIGHCYGPDSQEVLDITLRSDGTVRELLDYLDRQVGRGQYVIAVSADHGVCPLPNVASSQGKDAGYAPWDDWVKNSTTFLNEKHLSKGGKERWVEAQADEWLYLNRRVLKARNLDEAVVEQELADWFARLPGVEKVYTRQQLLSGSLKDDPIGLAVKRSFDPERSGDVNVILKPYYLVGKKMGTGTTHGSPHPYDTHVPLLLSGPGIEPGVYKEAVTPQIVTALLAHGLGIKPPVDAEARVPESMIKGAR
jgi:predicted AlkP superfamily pyrophosphatase or phosphodiesterase